MNKQIIVLLLCFSLLPQVLKANFITIGQTPLNNSIGDFNVRDASPNLNMYDTDATAGDVSAAIATACTDVGDGTEDCDIIFYQQQNGSLNAFLTSDADFALTIDPPQDVIAINATLFIDPVMRLTNTGAQAHFTMHDSDATDGDNNVAHFVNCTDVGSGTEDCDYIIQQQIAGSLSTVINADADDTIMFGRAVEALGNIEATNGALEYSDINDEGTCVNGTPDSITIDLSLGNHHMADQEDAACELSFSNGAAGEIHTIELEYQGDTAWTMGTGAHYLGDTFDESVCPGFQATAANGDSLILTVRAVDADTVMVLSCYFHDVS